MGKKLGSDMRLLPLLLVFVTAAFVFSGCGEELTPAEAVATYTQMLKDMDTYNTVRDSKKSVDRAISALHMNDDGFMTVFGDAFFEEYFKQYSEDDFMRSVMDAQHLPVLDIVTDYLLETFIETADVEFDVFSPALKGTDGYYKDNPNAYPQSSTREVEGRFYDHSGENGRTETRTITTTVEGYGDFAVCTQKGYHYDKGRYEWVYGVFYDELPSWNAFKDSTLYYKGKLLSVFGQNQSNSEFDISDEDSYSGLFIYPNEIDGVNYYYYNGANGSYCIRSVD